MWSLLRSRARSRLVWPVDHFRGAYDALGCLPPSHEPRATGRITDMIELTWRLIDSGHAYAACGDVSFSVRSLPGDGGAVPAKR